MNELQEQELRKGDFRRIFPVRETAADYIPFFSCADMREDLKKILPLLPVTPGAASASGPPQTPSATASAGATADTTAPAVAGATGAGDKQY